MWLVETHPSTRPAEAALGLSQLILASNADLSLRQMSLTRHPAVRPSLMTVLP